MEYPVNTERPRLPDVPAATVRVALVEAHYLVRAGLRSMLASQRSLRVVGEAARPAEALAVCDDGGADLVLVSLDAPDRTAVDAIEALKRERPDLRVVALASADDVDSILAAMRAGADGCVSKNAEKRDLLDVLSRAAAGTPAIEPALGALVLKRLAEDAGATVVPAPEPLTDREREVLRMLASGQTNRQIASRLVLAVGTVKVHVEHILSKLNVPDRTAAAVRGVELGIVELGVPLDDEPRRAESG